MKIQKISLDFDEDDAISIGLIRLLNPLPEHEFFFQVNKDNSIQFSRISDLVVHGKYYDYCHTRFQGYHHLTKDCIKIIKNQSNESAQKLMQAELFSTEQETNQLIKNNINIDYILICDNEINDFSLILPPKNALTIERYDLSSEDELYKLLLYYE